MIKNTSTTIFLLFSFAFLNGILYSQDDYSDWEQVYLKTGDQPTCYTFTPKYNFRLENFLRVSVGGNSDLVLKVVNNITESCIRYVYIHGGDTYEIRNIPEATYYVKIAFGNDWRINKFGLFCMAKFFDNEQYVKGEDILDFNTVKTYNGEQVPSYEIKLDVYTSIRKNAFDTEKISKEEFYK